MCITTLQFRTPSKKPFVIFFYDDEKTDTASSFSPFVRALVSKSPTNIQGSLLVIFNSFHRESSPVIPDSFYRESSSFDRPSVCNDPTRGFPLKTAGMTEGVREYRWKEFPISHKHFQWSIVSLPRTETASFLHQLTRRSPTRGKWLGVQGRLETPDNRYIQEPDPFRWAIRLSEVLRQPETS